MSQLAILGGTPLRSAPFPDWPQADTRDEHALLSAPPYVKNGENCVLFAERFAQYCGTPYCIPVANGTVSLELILRGLKIGYGDEVILPPYTFVATLSSIVYTGAHPVFADIEPDTYNISAESAVAKITPRTRAIVAVAIGGRPCDFDKLEKLAEKYGLYLIVDAAQAVGAQFNHKSIGQFGVAASFSCQNTKNLTCGEGGIITTSDTSLYENICAMLGTGPARDLPKLDHGLTERQAALLSSQMDKLDEQIRLRSENAAYLEQLLTGNPLLTPLRHDPRIQVDACHVHVLRVNHTLLAQYGLNRRDLLAAVNAEGFPLSAGYKPLYAFACASSPMIKAATGREIDLTPLPVCETAGYLEGVWIYQSTLLGTRQDMEELSSIVDKVYRHIEDLRKR